MTDQKTTITVQGSDNKILLIKIVFNEGKHKIVPYCMQAHSAWLFINRVDVTGAIMIIGIHYTITSVMEVNYYS